MRKPSVATGQTQAITVYACKAKTLKANQFYKPVQQQPIPMFLDFAFIAQEFVK